VSFDFQARFLTGWRPRVLLCCTD